MKTLLNRSCYINRMKKLHRSFLFIYLPLLISACTTTPYTRHKTPNISGILYIDQQPAKGVPIYLSTNGNDKYCREFTQKTLTGLKGKFSISSVKEQMNYTPLMTYYLDEWTICADISGSRKTLYSDNRYGKGSVTGSVHLKCNIDKSHFKKEVCNKPFLSE